MKVLIVDDEPPARQRLARLLREVPEVELVGEAGNGRAALEACAANNPDLVLLDISMPGMDGLEAAAHLAGLPQPPAVVFVTAYDEFALRAFEAQAVDYLLKPVRRERLFQALERAQRLTRAQLQSIEEERPDSTGRGHLSVQHQGRLLLIPVEDIVCFQADQKYVAVHHRGGEHLVDESLKNLEQEFGERFLRIHRNSLVARHALLGMERDREGRYHALLAGSELRPEVSRRQVSEVKKVLKVPDH